MHSSPGQLQIRKGESSFEVIGNLKYPLLSPTSNGHFRVLQTKIIKIRLDYNLHVHWFFRTLNVENLTNINKVTAKQKPSMVL